MKRPDTAAGAEALEQAVRRTAAILRRIEGYELSSGGILAARDTRPAQLSS